jgi:hypothetical protein
MLLLTIHDNFQYVQSAVQQFYRSKTPMLLLKLDIVKHFDNVGWEYILEILKQMGFDQRWRNMVSLIWSTMTCSTANSVTLSVMGGDHDRGSLVAHALHNSNGSPATASTPHPIGAATVKLWTSLYVDNAALFIRPVATELANL